MKQVTEKKEKKSYACIIPNIHKIMYFPHSGTMSNLKQTENKAESGVLRIYCVL